MHNQYADLAELRPTSEMSHVPDAKFNEGCDGNPWRQRGAMTTDETTPEASLFARDRRGAQ